jgi:dihydroorotase-like cyclic amidohydrolase
MPLTLICNATVPNGDRTTVADIFIVGDHIGGIESQLTMPPRCKVIEATGKLVLPGLIDLQVHLDETGDARADDFYTGTCAALAGGVTTVFALPTPRVSFDKLFLQATHKAVCDFGLFLAATPDDIESAWDVNAVGLCVATNVAVSSLEAHPRNRALMVPQAAYAAMLAEGLGRSVHVCSVSAAAEIETVRQAKVRGFPVTCSVALHHLLFHTDNPQHAQMLGRLDPPLRAESDVRALWDNLAYIDAIVSDHSSSAPGLETLLPLLLDAVQRKQLSLADAVRLTSTGPAAVMGLARKVGLVPGGSADLVIVAPDATWTPAADQLRSRCGWTPYAGWPMRGRVEKVFVRGELVYDQGEVLAQPGSGKPVHCVS